MVVESDDEHFIIGIARMYKRQRRRDHFGLLRSHAAARVKNDAHRYGTVLCGELLNSLRMAVLVDFKILRLETSYFGAMDITYANVKYNQLTGRAKREFRLGLGVYSLTSQERSQRKGEHEVGGVEHDWSKSRQVAHATCPLL